MKVLLSALLIMLSGVTAVVAQQTALANLEGGDDEEDDEGGDDDTGSGEGDGFKDPGNGNPPWGLSY